MINFENVSKIFKSDLLTQPFVALNDVSFQIPSGSMVGFLGANGAGKTTSLKIIMDFIRPSSGEVKFSEELGSTQEEVFRNIGFLPERPYFYPHLTGEEFLTFMGKLSELSSQDIVFGIKKWAPLFKIEHALKREVKTYSKGMLQRLGFRATILHKPKLIILDEPLSGLDPIGRKELKDVIIDVHKEGKTVFFSSHIVPDIEEICDRVIFLKEGKLVYDGNVDQLMGNNSELDFILTVRSFSDIKSSVKYKEMKRLPDNIVKFVVKKEYKDIILLELLQQNINVIGLEKVRPSLEEIFYQTKGGVNVSL